MTSTKVLSDLRIILRHLKTLPSSGTNGFKSYVLDQFRSNSFVSDALEVRAMRDKAQVVAEMMVDLRNRKELLALNAGEKMSQMERTALTAGRVGLNMPQQYVEQANDGSENMNHEEAASR